MKIKENKKWSISSVRGCCISNEFYTHGDCASYDKMLNFVSTHKPTLANMYKVACDILAHSNEQTVENIMYCLNADAIYTFYEIND